MEIKRPLLLISNDDGYQAKGINTLVEMLSDMGDILVGLAWGVTVGWGVYLIMRRHIGSLQDINMRPAIIAILLTFVIIVVSAPILAA